MPSTLGIVASGFYNKTMYISVVGATSDYLSVYPFDIVNGFGTKVVAPTSSPPTAAQTDTAWNPDNSVVITTQGSSPYVNAWAFSGGAWGTKYSDPVTLPTSSAVSPQFSTSGTDVITAAGANFNIYRWSSGWGTKYSSTTLPSSFLSNGTTFMLNDTAVAVSWEQSPYMYGYPFTSGTGLGTKWTDPASTIASRGGRVSYDKNTQTLVQITQLSGTPSGIGWPVSVSGFGTALSGTYPSQANAGVLDHDKRGESIFFSFGNNSPFIRRYAWTSSGLGSALTGPTGAGSTQSVSVSPDNTAVVAYNTATPFIRVWPIRSSTTMGTVYSNPSSLPAGGAGKAKFSN